MSLPAATESPSPLAVFDDDAWEDLLNFIEEKRVIPIVGPELAVLQTEAPAAQMSAASSSAP